MTHGVKKAPYVMAAVTFSSHGPATPRGASPSYMLQLALGSPFRPAIASLVGCAAPSHQSSPRVRVNTGIGGWEVKEEKMERRRRRRKNKRKRKKRKRRGGGEEERKKRRKNRRR